MKNYKGETISEIRQLKRPEYGTGEKYKNGNPIVDWSHLSKYADKNGFDSPGGAIQYYHPITIRESIRRGLLKRIKK